MTITQGASALAAMPPDDFEAVVRASLGRDAERAVWDALTDPAVISRTRDALGAIHADVQNQLNLANTDIQQAKDEGYSRGEEGKQAYIAARASQAEWRRKAVYFRRLVEQRLAFVKSRAPRPEPSQPRGSHTTRRVNQEALESLARAVIAHRDKVLSGEGGEDDDDALWDCLDTITAATLSGGEMPLAKWVDWLDEVREADE